MTEHFHSIKDGCQIETYYKNPKYGKIIINFVKCKTHNKKICRCGWEWHWHNGEDIKHLYSFHQRKCGLKYKKNFNLTPSQKEL